MSRVEILGQFNVDYPCIASMRGQVQIDPSASTSLLPTIPSNWVAFTESANRILSPLTTLRLYVKVLGLLMYIILIALIVVFGVLPNVLKEDSFRLPESYNFVPFVAFAFLFLYLWIQMRIRLTGTMNQLTVVCDQYSDNEHVTYELQSEHWGGCNKPHVRRYFLLVHGPSSNDMEAPAPPSYSVQPTVNDIFVDGGHSQQEQDETMYKNDNVLQSNQRSATVTTTTTTTTTTTSLFDQLKLDKV